MLTDLEASDCAIARDYKHIDEILTLLNAILINDGKIDGSVLDVFAWEVYPVERDSFGWVLAAVVTKKGDIVFG